MKECVLVVVKPDGTVKGIIGEILSRFLQAGLEVVGAKVITVPREKAKEHYGHLKDKPFYNQTVDYLTGKFHGNSKAMALVFMGEDAVRVSRDLAGATDPRQADSSTIRGAFGRIARDGLFENVVHVSSDAAEARREIMLWFEPNEIAVEIYPVRKSWAFVTTRTVWV